MDPLAARIRPKILPEVDAGIIPASLWERAYRQLVRQQGDQESLVIGGERPDGSGTVISSHVCVSTPEHRALACRHAERRVKFLLWACGGSTLHVDGPAAVIDHLKEVYSPTGPRHFDFEFMGERVYGAPFRIIACAPGAVPGLKESPLALGGHLDGCRIGFDLGGSDRKCAAVIDGKVAFSEETPWNPYFESDPNYHIEGIRASLKAAAAHLPRIDAIGGSAAGIYVRNEIRVSSLFRGIEANVFAEKVRPLFHLLQAEWGVPFEVANDGDVTALAGSMALGRNGILGISMGTSLAAGYVTREGGVTPRLSELAFAPVDYRPDGPIDEWSGDHGCGVQYFSQQGVARLAPLAGIDLPADMPLAERLAEIQRMHSSGDDRAASIFRTIGINFGYALAHYADFYDFEYVQLLGRVTSGPGGSAIVEEATRVLEAEFPDLAAKISIVVPDEKQKRHGQAIAAASLPPLPK